MVQRSLKNYLQILFLLLIQISIGCSYIWMDERPENQIYDESENRLDEQKLINKKVERIGVSPDLFKRNFHAFPVYKTANNKHCNCELNFKHVDLGKEYYPRYIHTGICHPNSCDKFYQCIEKKYTMKVIRKKDYKDADEMVPSSLPKSLRNSWMEESIEVAVACECVMDI